MTSTNPPRWAADSLAAHLGLPPGNVTVDATRAKGGFPTLIVRGVSPSDLPRVWHGFCVRAYSPAPLA